MITAIVLISVESWEPSVAAARENLTLNNITNVDIISADVNRIPEVAQEIANLPGVTEVYSVAGDADLIAMVRVRQHEQLADVIADRLNKVPGVTGTATHIAFRTYSQHDLEAAFSLGID